MLVQSWAVLALVTVLAVFVLGLVALIGLLITLATHQQHRKSRTSAPDLARTVPWWTIIVGLATIIGAAFTAANFLTG